MIAGSSLFFPMIHMLYQICCVCPALLGFWFQTYLGCKNSASFLKYRQGRLFLTIVMCWSCSMSTFCALIAQNLTGEFMRKIHAASWKLFTLTAEADRVFMSTCDIFNCLFPLDVQNETQLLSGVFCYSWLVCLLGFGWEIRCLSKSEIWFRMALFSFSPCLMRKRVAKSEAILALLDTFQELNLEGKPE